jgi:SAM-dependent methyltransferase
VTDGYNPNDFSRLLPVEDTHFWFTTRNRILSAVLTKLAADISTTGNVLEIGCGTGNTLRVMRQAFPSVMLVGMDLLHSGLVHAKHRTDAVLVQGRIEEMPFARPFVLIGMFDVLEHVDDDVAALSRIARFLEPSGALILTVPASPSLWSRYDEESFHKRRYTASGLRAALTEARFRVEYLTHFMALTYPAVWLSRRLDGLRKRFARSGSSLREPAIVRELNVPRPVNMVLGRLLGLEVPFIRQRGCLPFGTSLLAVARP